MMGCIRIHVVVVVRIIHIILHGRTKHATIACPRKVLVTCLAPLWARRAGTGVQTNIQVEKEEFGAWSYHYYYYS